VIIMASNAGVELIKRESAIGFAVQKNKDNAENTYHLMKDKVMNEVKKTFRPEFLNRLDEIIVFHELSKENLNRVIDLMLIDLQKRLAEHELKLEITEEAKSWLAETGYNPVYGARPLRRAIEQHLENKLAAKMLRGEFKAGDTITVDRGADGLTFGAVKPVKKSSKKRDTK